MTWRPQPSGDNGAFTDAEAAMLRDEVKKLELGRSVDVWLCGCVVARFVRFVWLCVVVWSSGVVVWSCGLCGCVVVWLCGRSV